MKTLKLALLGYGNAGRAFGALLTQKHELIEEKYGTDVKISAIATKTKGTLIGPDGIDLAKAEEGLRSHGKFQGGLDMDSIQVAGEADYDALLELTPLNIFTGRPAIDHIEAAFRRGKHVISANKGPIARAWHRMREMADENGCHFFFETTVMDGTPVFNLVFDTLKMCKVIEITGILNSTTNFILEELADGVPYDEAIREGRERGFVEADPSLDVEGWDAAAKITALMNVLMDADLKPEYIERTGIENISRRDIEEAEKNGKLIKLLCSGKIIDGKATGTVKPAEIDRGDMLASVTGTTSAVSIKTDLMGTITIVEHEPEIEQTAYGIFSDLIRLIERL